MISDEHWIQSAVNRFSGEGSVRSVQSVGGGCISRAWKVRTDSPGADYFIKQNTLDFLDNFEAESDGLRSLSLAAKSVDHLQVPEALFAGEVDGNACLILKWIDSAANLVDEFHYGQVIAMFA